MQQPANYVEMQRERGRMRQRSPIFGANVYSRDGKA